MKSKIFSSEYIRTVSKGYMWIPAFLTLGFLLVFPVASILMLGNWKAMDYTQGQIGILYENLWRDGFLIAGGAVTAGAAFLNGIRGFSYLYSPKQTDFYHSLPIKRGRLFWGRTYIGFLYFMVPYGLMEFLTVCIGAAEGYFSLRLMAMAVKLLALHLLVYLLLYFSVVLVECVTGNLLMGFLGLAGIQLYGAALSILLMCCGQTFFHTFFTDRTYGVFLFLEKYVSPAFLAENFLNQYSEGRLSVSLTAAVLAVTGVLAVLSSKAYESRPSEASGRPIVYRWIEKVVKLLVVIPCGLGTGFIFHVLPSSGTRFFWWVFGMLLGTILSHGLLEILYQMNFRGFFFRKKELLVSVLLVLACGMVYQLDLTGFDHYLPEQNQLESVSVDFMTLAGQYGSQVDKERGGTFHIRDLSDWSYGGMELSSEKGIGKETYEILKSIVNNQDGRNPEEIQDETEQEWTYYTGIKYKMKSGKEVYRRYSISPAESRELIRCLFDEENLRDQIFSFLKLDDSYLSDLNLTCVDGLSYSVFQNDKEGQEKFLEALEQDLREADGMDMVGIPCAKLDVSYQLPVKATADQLIPGREQLTNAAYWSVNIYPSYKRTLAILKETACPLSLYDMDIAKVSVMYYDDSDTFQNIEYSEPEEIEALKEDMVPGFLMCSWLDYFPEAGAVIYLDKNQTSGAYMYLLEDRIPDFVADQIQRKIREKKLHEE